MQASPFSKAYMAYSYLQSAREICAMAFNNADLNAHIDAALTIAKSAAGNLVQDEFPTEGE